jgi:hypothetical protein
MLFYPLTHAQLAFPLARNSFSPLSEPAMADFVERRELPRMSVRWPVTLHYPEGTVQGQTKNISATGACIECDTLLSVNEPYWMEVEIPQRPVAVRGIVIWSSLIINRSETEVSHAGLSITTIEEEDREWFNATILEGGT